MRRFNRDGEHFWVASYPFFDTSLVITPPTVATSETWSTIFIYDCDGACVNQTTVQFESDRVAVLQLDPLMGSCKFESGFKLAHIIAKSELPGVSHQCRLVAQDRATILGPCFSTLPTQPSFLPISFAPGKQSLVTVVNYGDTESSLRIRLFFGTRTPEILVTVPPLGARVVGVEAEFSDCAERATDRAMQAYLRMTTKSESGLGIQLIERTEGPRDSNVFSSLA